MKCSKCGYEWKCRSLLKYVSCPSCMSKVRVLQQIDDIKEEKDPFKIEIGGE